MVSDQRSSIQVHQCVPPEVLYTGSPMCSTRGPLYRFTNVFHQRSSTGSPMCSIRGPLSRFTSVFNQRSSIQVHQCVPPEVRYTGSPVCSTSTLRQVKKKGQFPGKMYLLTLKNWQLNTTIKGQASLMVSSQHSSIQVHQCVPPVVLYTGSPVCSTSGPLYRFTRVFNQRSSAGSPMCSTRGPLYRFTSVFHQRSSTGSPMCSTRGPLYGFTSVFNQRSSTGSPMCSTRGPLYRFTSMFH